MKVDDNFTQLLIIKMLAARLKLIVWDNILQLQILQNVKKYDNTYTLTVNLGTVIQLLFVTTLFCDLSEKKWFAVTNLCDQDVDYLETYYLVRGEKYLW